MRAKAHQLFDRAIVSCSAVARHQGFRRRYPIDCSAFKPRNNNMRAFAVAILLASVGMANAADSGVTELVTDRCTVTMVETEDEAGEPLKKEDYYPTAWRCTGNGGLFVYVLYGHEREEIAFGTARRETTGYMRHGHFGSWGPSVEWRGRKNKNGQLAAMAAIVAYRWDIRNGDNENDREVGGDLAV